MMELQDFLDHVARGATIESGSQEHAFMHDAAQDALRVLGVLNTGYRTPEEPRALLAASPAAPCTKTVTLFPPFHCEFGKNLTLGRNVLRYAVTSPPA